MKLKVVLLFVVITALFSIVSTAPESHGAAQRLLAVTPDKFDAGTVDEGQVIKATATIENRGEKTIQITNVRTN